MARLFDGRGGHPHRHPASGAAGGLGKRAKPWWLPARGARAVRAEHDPELVDPTWQIQVAPCWPDAGATLPSWLMSVGRAS
ncbi:hypothetical protein [Streptomyces sp. NBC_00648]|uniref:hypothetical protein n=1 Tax=Streptomyces sp. NBC_00648 TaxID=2975797 RepID=UPI0032554815